MARPVRKKRLPKKFYSSNEHEKSPKLKANEKLPRIRGLKKNETVALDVLGSKVSLRSTQRSESLKDKNNVVDEMEKMIRDDSKVQKTTVERRKTKKPNTRLNKEKSKKDGNMKDEISVKAETEKRESSEIQRGNRLRKRNESKGNNSNIENQNKSSDNDKTQAVTTKNKFFKSKKLANGSGILLMQKGAIKAKIVKKSDKQTKEKDSLGFAPSLRQSTLSESFKRGSLRARLRPRKNAKDYRDSSILEKNLSLDKRNSIVLLERMDDPKTDTAPVYKRMKSCDERNKDKDSIYDFQFDVNDPEEKSGKNKKKVKTTRKPATRRKRKIVPAKTVLDKNDNTVVTPLSLPEPNKKIIEKPSKKKVLTTAQENGKDEINDRKQSEDRKHEPLAEIIEDKGEDAPEQVVERSKSPVSNEKVPLQVNFKEKNPLPIIRQVETLIGDRKVSFEPNLSISRQSSATFNPFRSTQSIFKPRTTSNTRDMMDHSLLNKSLSPIKNVLDRFDPASPWRPSISNSFDRVKQLVQSTPQVKKSFARATQGFRIDENDENDANAENRETGGTSPAIKQPNKKAVNPLGMRISNVKNIQVSNLGRSDSLFPMETETSLTRFGKGKESSNLWKNKDNSGFADRLFKSPTKTNEKSSSSHGSPGFKKRNNLYAINEMPSTSSMKQFSEIHENENSPPIEEELKSLKQSNLNSFLNIDDMPESITINTSYGIFGDAQSTSIIRTNQTSKVQPQANIENCFGFDDEYSSDIQVSSPVKLDKKPAATPVKKVYQRLKGKVLPLDTQSASSLALKNTARISLGEIKNTLYPKKEMKFDTQKRREEKIKKREIDILVKDVPNKKTKDLLSAVQFSDTFDILSESGKGEGDEKSLGTEIMLFTDLEPVHFSKPPRWSYAKKRECKQYLSSDEDDDDAKHCDAPVLKKRKVAQINKVEEKKIDEWVKSVNETFQEIDDFDLVVEKLS